MKDSMNIPTLEQLKEANACTDGYTFYEKNCRTVEDLKRHRFKPVSGHIVPTDIADQKKND